MTQAERYDLLEVSIAKLNRLRLDLLGEARIDYENWIGDGEAPIKFPDGSVVQR